MKNQNKYGYQMDKKKLLREQDHLTRPPRMNGKPKGNKMKPKRK